MAVKKKKSKKPLEASSTRLPDIFKFYLDRNLGSLVVADRFREAGEKCHIHDDYLPQDAPDEEWISLVGRKGWIGITKDRNIQYRTFEHQQIVHSKAKVVVIRAKDVTGAQIGEILIKHISKIKNFDKKNDAPYLIGMDRNGKISRYKLRLQ